MLSRASQSSAHTKSQARSVNFAWCRLIYWRRWRISSGKKQWTAIWGLGGDILHQLYKGIPPGELIVNDTNINIHFNLHNNIPYINILFLLITWSRFKTLGGDRLRASNSRKFVVVWGGSQHMWPHDGLWLAETPQEQKKWLRLL